jgi:hypothetical protein
MLPDIENFSTALDIDTADALEVRLHLRKHGDIQYRMRLNGHLILDLDSVWYFNLMSPLHLHCLVSQTNNAALEIVNFNVNGIEVLPRYQHLAQPATAWINQEGSWDFHTPASFYFWFHEISGQGWVA